MPCNIVICCDGTDNEFGYQNSNVVRLIQSLDRDPTQQRLYYDPGIGTLPDPTFWNAVAYLRAKTANLADRMMAWGLEQNVQEAYAYLMDYWELGDRVYLFGFSRGAYTARVLAGMLHVMGLLPRGNHNLFPYVMRLYKSIRGRDPTKKAHDRNYWKLCSKFRTTFSRETSHKARRFPVRFLGLWDTVSTVGWLWNPTTYPNTRSNGSIQTIRHAVSIDERRAFFRQNLTAAKFGQDVEQLWFAGDHSDVGGGHPEDHGGLWRIPFQWMVDGARAAGIHINDNRLTAVLQEVPPPAQPWLEPQHSLLRKWWLAELVPKRQWDWAAGQERWRCGRFGYRHVPHGSLIHESVLRRLQTSQPSYDPPNLSAAFKQHIRQAEHLSGVVATF